MGLQLLLYAEHRNISNSVSIGFAGGRLGVLQLSVLATGAAIFEKCMLEPLGSPKEPHLEAGSLEQLRLRPRILSPKNFMPGEQLGRPWRQKGRARLLHAGGFTV